MSADGDVLKLYVTTDLPGEGNLTLRMSPEIADEVRALLDETDLEHSAAAEFSSGPELVLEVVRVLGPAGGALGLASVINTLIKRHNGNRLVIERGGEKFEASNYSAKDVERLILLRTQEQAEIEAKFRSDIGGADAGDTT